MFKKLAITTTIGSSILGTGLHFLSHGYVALENYTVNRVEHFYSNTIEGLAKDHGFIKPRVLDDRSRDDIIKREAVVNKVPVALAKAVIKAESNNNQFATSHANARGLMQVMDFHVDNCGLNHYSELYDEEKNIMCGMKILGQCLRNNKGDIMRALKEYNAGPARIDKTDENRKYPHIVLSKLE